MSDSGRQGSHQQYEVVVERNVIVSMRDGVKLATDIYFPALEGSPAKGRFPAILERSPYGKQIRLDMVKSGNYFARRGYVVAIQDVRGRFDSEGVWYAFANEAPDGYDAVEWVAQQKWCDGQVGTMGLSYSGSDQSALATMNPPHLKCMFVSEGASNYHTCSMRHNGACELTFFVYAFRMALSSKEALKDPAKRAAAEQAYRNVGHWLTRHPHGKGTSPLSLFPTYEQWILDIMTTGDYNEYWKQRGYSIEEYYDEHADVSAYYLGGWYDSYTRATTDNYVRLSTMKKEPIRLIMGPWSHGAQTLELSRCGDVEFGADAALDYNDFRLRWFDYNLKGLDTGIMDDPPVKIFVMGGGDGRKTIDEGLNHGGRWRFENQWPLERTIYTKYYIHLDGRLSTDVPDDDPPSSYTFDPHDPVPTIGGNISAADDVISAGAFDQRGREDFFGCRDSMPLSARNDVLVFQTDVLEKEVEVTGPLTFVLWASSSALDTDFTVKLLDVYPPMRTILRGSI